MRRGSSLALGALAVVGAAAAWVLLSASGTEGPRGETSEGGEEEAVSGAEVLAADDRAQAVGYRVEDGVGVPKGRVSAEPGPGVFVVQVVDDRGQPVPDRTVHLGNVTPSLAAEPYARKTDASGLCRWTGLAGPFASAQARDPGWTDAFEVGAVGGPLLVLRSERTAVARIRVVGPDGAPVSRAQIVLLAPSLGDEPSGLQLSRGRPVTRANWLEMARSDHQGIARLEAPPWNSQGRLWVSAEGHANWLDREWRLHDTEIRLEKGADIDGLVRGEGGGVLADGVVAWETDAGLWGEERVEWDGTFEISRLPARPVRLAWRLVDVPTLDGRNVMTATAGPGRTTFVVTVGARLAVEISGWPREPGGLATLTRQDEPAATPALVSEIDLDGVVRFVGLEPDRLYVLWVPPFRAERVGPGGEKRLGVVLRRDVVASETPVAVSLVAGRSVRGVVDLTGTAAATPSGPRGPWWSVSVVLKGVGVSLGAHVADVDPGNPREVPFRVEGVPEGSYTLRAKLELDDADGPRSTWIGEVPAPSTDEPARITLRPGPLEKR